jgi:ACR3 family arsenite efflux pump ArsB
VVCSGLLLLIIPLIAGMGERNIGNRRKVALN